MGSTLWVLGTYILLSQVSTEFKLASSLLELLENVGQRDSYNGEYWSYSLIVPPRGRYPRAFFVVCCHPWLCYSVVSPSSHSTNNIHVGKYPRRHLKRLRGTKIDMTRLHKRPTILVLLQIHVNINAVHSKQSADKNREPHHSWVQWLNRKSACSFRIDQALTLESGVLWCHSDTSSQAKESRKESKQCMMTVIILSPQHISDLSPEYGDLEPQPLLMPLLISIAIYESSWQAWPSYRPHFCYFPKTYWKAQTYLVSWGHCSENEKMYDPLCGCIWTPNWIPSN